MAKVRVEWVCLTRPEFDRGGSVNDASATMGAQTVVVGGVSVLTTAAPNFVGPDGVARIDGFARVSAVSGAVNLAWGSTPTASEAFGLRLEAGRQILVPLSTGQQLALIEAADGPVTVSVQDQSSETALSAIESRLQGTLDVQTHPIQADAISRSAILVGAGLAQDLAPANTSRKGWRVQNQSTANLYVRSKGASGLSVATLDNASFLIPPGATWTEDGHVTPYALSIVGPSAGQSFYAREW